MIDCGATCLAGRVLDPSVTGRRHSLPSSRAAAPSRYELPPPLAAPVLRQEGLEGAVAAAVGGPRASFEPATTAPPAAGSAAAAWQAAMEEARRLPSPGWAAQGSGAADQQQQSPLQPPPQQQQQQQQAGGRGAEQPLPVPAISSGRSSPVEVNDAERRRLKRYTPACTLWLATLQSMGAAFLCSVHVAPYTTAASYVSSYEGLPICTKGTGWAATKGTDSSDGPLAP
jgi:hypothetical protein